jgi:hypothetical protein
VTWEYPARGPVTSFLSIRYRLQSFKVGAEIPVWMMRIMSYRTRSLTSVFGAKMGEIIRFVPKSGRERARLIREARAIYDSIFPPADPVSEQRDKASISHTISRANAHRSDLVLLS